MVKSRYIGMVIPPLIGNPYNWYINPYYWVDDHPLLYGNKWVSTELTPPPPWLISLLGASKFQCSKISVNFGQVLPPPPIVHGKQDILKQWNIIISRWWFFPTHLKKNMRTVKLDSISPGIGVKIKHIWNHHLDYTGWLIGILLMVVIIPILLGIFLCHLCQGLTFKLLISEYT